MISNNPRLVPFALKRHRPFSLSVDFLKADKKPLDLTGAVLRLVISQPEYRGGALLTSSTATLVDAVAGLAQFDIQGDDINMAAGQYVLSATLVSAEGFESSIFEGDVEVVHNPDPVVPLDYTEVIAPLGLTVTMRSQNRVTIRVNHTPDSVLLAMVELAQTAASAAGLSADEAEGSAGAAAASAVSANDSAAAANLSAIDAATSAGQSGTYATEAGVSADEAAASAAASAVSATQSYGFSIDSRDWRDASQLAAARAEAAAALAEGDGGGSVPAPPEVDGKYLVTNGLGGAIGYEWRNLALPEHNHDALYYTEGEIDGKFIDFGSAVATNHYTKAQSDAAFAPAGNYIAQTADIVSIVKITQAAYDALTPPLATRLYIIVG